MSEHDFHTSPPPAALPKDAFRLTEGCVESALLRQAPLSAMVESFRKTQILQLFVPRSTPGGTPRRLPISARRPPSRIPESAPSAPQKRPAISPSAPRALPDSARASRAFWYAGSANPPRAAYVRPPYQRCFYGEKRCEGPKSCRANDYRLSSWWLRGAMAPRAGLEPATRRLTVACSTN